MGAEENGIFYGYSKFKNNGYICEVTSKKQLFDGWEDLVGRRD